MHGAKLGLALSFAIGVSSLHCATEGAVSSAPHRGSVPLAYVARPPVPDGFVPEGTPFEVRLDRAVGTEFSEPGQPVTARVIWPMHGPTGKVLVKPGALLSGAVVSVSPERNRILLCLTTLETITGPAPVVAEVLHADAVARSLDFYDPKATYELILTAPPSSSLDTNVRYYIPIGGLVRFALTRPLVLPADTARLAADTQRAAQTSAPPSTKTIAGP